MISPSTVPQCYTTGSRQQVTCLRYSRLDRGERGGRVLSIAFVLHTYKRYHRCQAPGELNDRTTRLPLASVQHYYRLQAIPALSSFEPARESVSCSRCLLHSDTTGYQHPDDSIIPSHNPGLPGITAKSVQMVHKLRSRRGPLAFELCSERDQKNKTTGRAGNNTWTKNISRGNKRRWEKMVQF